MWDRAGVKGSVEADNGEVAGMAVGGGKYKAGVRDFRSTGQGESSITVRFSGVHIAPGPGPTVVHINTERNAFSFFLRDVVDATPIYIPSYGVVVVPETDHRSYAQIEKEILSRGLLTKAGQIGRQPEASFEQVAPFTRNMSAPVWLGPGRDIRKFEITEEMPDIHNGEDKVIRPLLSSLSFDIPETGAHQLLYRYALGRGVGALDNITRRLEQGTLPVFHSEMRDDDILYRSVSFASLEKQLLTAENLKGIDYMISDSYSIGRVFTPQQQKELEQKRQSMEMPDQEVVLYCRTQIVNTGRVPRYAWFKVPYPAIPVGYGYDPKSGFSGYAPDRIFCVSTLDGKPVPNEETAVLVQPGDSVCFDFRLTHRPVDAKRAGELRDVSFDKQYAACKSFWQGKLDRAAAIKVPEKRIDEMIRAGLLHLDLNTSGIEPDQPLAANVGVYSPIGTESAPIIQFYCSMGLDDMARRSLDYFLVTQQEDGRIMNYHGYTVETGAALWCMGEYFRYTRDAEWIRSNKAKLVRACEFLIQWRASDPKSAGMISGKVADPEDSYRQFMLNGYGYLGLKRMAGVMGELGEPEAQRFAVEAEAWRQAIRAAALEAMEKSPVVPLGDGTWCPTLPPWPEAPGPRLLYQKAEKFRSHGTFTAPDAGLGPAYLVFCEVFEPEERLSEAVMTGVAEIMCQGNTGFSQPYYGRLNWWQITQGMVKPFLNAYYTTISAHADRETYTFWEHFFRLSPHKTHEEAGFLMDTRWMLYMECGDTLHLFPAVPRVWLEEGKEIRLEGVRSYFGALDVTVKGVEGGKIEAVVECKGERKPRCVSVRLPHPEGEKATGVTGVEGVYDAAAESVLIENFDGRAAFTLDFNPGGEPLGLVCSTAENMAAEVSGGCCRILTTGKDPYIHTSLLTRQRTEDEQVLSFEYKSSAPLDFIQVFLADPITEARSCRAERIPASANWRECSIVLKERLAQVEWGKPGDYLRLDLGDATGWEGELRNVKLRAMNEAERDAERQHMAYLAGQQRLGEALGGYLAARYASTVDEVNAGAEVIRVRGRVSGPGTFRLVEIAPWEDVAQVGKFGPGTPLAEGAFSETFGRYVSREGLNYDRTLSRWIIVKEGEGGDRIASHARYAGFIEPSQATVAEKPASKKGIGDCRDFAMLISDLDTLGITSATVNIRIMSMMYSQPGPNRMAHVYGGTTYYFDQAQVAWLDRSTTACRERGIVVAGIILLNPASQSVDPVLGTLMQHPDFTSSGRYTMPDMTSPQSVNAYAAALDFLAARYTRADKLYGRIQHWIMHNEVDSPQEWTNMGAGKPVGVYMEAYHKSMRLCRNIVNRYDSHAEVMASHTHAWAVQDNPDTYATLDMLNILNGYCRAEGDFRWGLAFHCYPRDLNDPKTWLDHNALYTPLSPIITYKNLEVLDRWAFLPENLYLGREKRTVWLSENGANSPTYSEQDLTAQAAALAWGWKKIAVLDGIDAHQWHNWADHPEEFGLRIGLRQYPENGFDPKPVWYVYKAAGTPAEERVFRPYLEMIGLMDWNILQPVR